MLFLRYLCIVYKLSCYALAKHTFYLTTLCQMAQPVYYTIFFIYIRCVQENYYIFEV